jgi:hypothetical protein
MPTTLTNTTIAEKTQEHSYYTTNTNTIYHITTEQTTPHQGKEVNNAATKLLVQTHQIF